MQNTIYLASYGEYSDKGIDCYFTSEEECEKYCQLKNEVAEDDWDYTYYYVEPLECKDGMIDLSNIKPRYLYQFKTNFEDCWNVSHEELCRESKSGIIEYGHSGRIMIQVVITEKNRDNAVKIAQDMYAKYNAEKNNL